MTGRAVAIVSGGLDSVTLAHHLADDGYDLHLITADYGQRHHREISYAYACAQRLGARWDCVDLRSLAPLFGDSSLTNTDRPVPEGHYEDEAMKQTIVPNRNAILLSIGVAAAVTDGAALVATAVHAGDHAIYPDCREDFIAAIGRAFQLGNSWADPLPVVSAPFSSWSKADIVRRGAELGVPFAETWSCYLGGTRHCGTCGTDYERKEAFRDAKVEDPTDYEDASVPESVTR